MTAILACSFYIKDGRQNPLKNVRINENYDEKNMEKRVLE